MFIRTSSYLNNYSKSECFKNKLAHSFQFNGHRCNLSRTSFSIGVNYTAGYTFKRTVVTAGPNAWRSTLPNHGEHAAKLLSQHGIKAYLQFDGSGDSGEIVIDSLTTMDTDLDLKEYSDCIGVLEPVEESHEHLLNIPTTSWRSVSVRNLEDAIIHMGYEALGETHPGWEINCGSNGKIDIVHDGIAIDYEEGYYTCENCGDDYDDCQSCACEYCEECGERSDNGSTECSHCGEKIFKPS